jgi:hypothetical protein
VNRLVTCPTPARLHFFPRRERRGGSHAETRGGIILSSWFFLRLRQAVDHFLNETKIRIPMGSMVSRGIQRAFVTFVSAAKEKRGFIESESERAR